MIYPWIFSMLPGPLWARIAEAAALVVAAILLLMLVVFPFIGGYVSLFSESLVG